MRLITIWFLFHVSMAFCQKIYPLLITGCARSGTGYISAVLNQAGLDFGHEYLDSYGLSCWQWAFDTKEATAWCEPRKGVQFAHTFHQVRHPLKAITSLFLNDPPTSTATWSYIKKQIPEIKHQDSHIVKCAKYWYYWNLQAEKIAEWTYRIEHLEEELSTFESKLGIVLDKERLRYISKKKNERIFITKYFSWKRLKRELPPWLFHSIVDMTKRYGYSIPESSLWGKAGLGPIFDTRNKGDCVFWLDIK